MRHPDLCGSLFLRMSKTFLAAAAAWIFCSACSKPPPSGPAQDRVGSSATPSPPAAAAAIDACALLTSEEIQSIQGEPIKEAKSTTQSTGGLVVSQCYFALPTMVNSISLQVTQGGVGPGARKVSEIWNEYFGKEAPLMQESNKAGVPRRIEGLGEKAYWVGNDKIGVLSVLFKNSYLTLSIGGAGDQQVKIERCTELARKILARL